jgi:signal transduction histidine kinase
VRPHDRLPGVRAAEPGQTFAQWVDPGSVAQAERFMATLLRNRAAFDWSLGVQVAGAPQMLSFAGSEVDGGLLILAAATRSALAGFTEELVRINNEQGNALRSAMKSLALSSRRAGTEDTALMEELSRVNNELATAQRELARKNAELARLNLQKNELLGIAAHDLRNPLDVIASYSLFLLQDLHARLDAEHRTFLGRIQASSEFMRNLVDGLLDYARIEAGRLHLDLAPVDIVEVVERNVDLNQTVASRRSLRIALDARPCPSIAADVTRIEQVMNNLLGNAMKFSPPGSTICVRVAPRDETVAIDVADEGPGIPDDARQRLFEPFERGPHRPAGGEKGTGLGLAIVKRIVDAHGGSIALSASPSGGCLFRIELPIARVEEGV